MDAKCYITSCEVLDIGIGIVNELAYGIDCETAKYCNFARFYVENDLSITTDPFEPPIVDPEIPEIIIEPPIIEGVVNISYSFIEYVCVVIEEITTTTTSTTTTTTTTIDCFVDFNIIPLFETTTTTSTTSTTTTTLPQLETCNIQVDILEITWD